MFDYILGLPMHPLVIHAVVVLVPLAALLAVAHVLVPKWRRALRWPVLLGGLVTVSTAFVAAQSGERLLMRVSQVRADSTNFDLLATHQMWGERAWYASIGFAVAALLAAAVLRSPSTEGPRRRPLEMLVAVVMLLSAAGVTALVALAGHAGSAVVWDGLAA